MSDGVVLGVEFEDDGVTFGGCDGVWREDEAVFADADGLAGLGEGIASEC